MLKSINISHYKSLSEVNLKFNKSNIIVGTNGSGKSNLVDSLNFIKDATEEDLDFATTKRHGVESVRQWSRSRPYNVTFDLDFESDDDAGSYKVILSSSRGAFKVVEEIATCRGQGLSLGRNSKPINWAQFTRNEAGEVSFSVDTDNDDISRLLSGSITVPKTDLYLSQIPKRAQSIFTIMFGTLISEILSLSTYAIYPNTIRQPQLATRDEILSSDGSNLASIVKRLNSSQDDNKSRLMDSLRFVLPTVAEMKIGSNSGYYVPTVRVVEPGGSHFLNMSQLSDGTLRILGLLTAFYQPRAPRKICLEEPEQMIHPGLLSVLRDAAEDYLSMGADRQFFITTHSPQFIDLFDPRNIIWVSFKDGITEAGKISERQLSIIKKHLFSAGELLVAEGLGGMTVFAIVAEGIGDVQALPSLLAKVAAQCGEVSYASNVVRAAGWPSLKRPGQLERFCHLASSHDRVEKIIVVADLDDGCVKEEIAGLQDRIAGISAQIGKPVALCFCLREYEAWFLEVVDQLKTSIPEISWRETDYAGNAIGVRAAKEAFEKLIGAKYRESVDQAKFTKAIDVRLLYERSRSFRKFCKEVLDVDYDACEIMLDLSLK